MLRRVWKFYLTVVCINALLVSALFYSLYGSALDYKRGSVSHMECVSMPGRSENFILKIEGEEYWTILGSKSCRIMADYSGESYAEIQYTRNNNYIRSLRLDGRTVFNDRTDSAFSFIWWILVLLLSNYYLMRLIKNSKFMNDGRRPR